MAVRKKKNPPQILKFKNTGGGTFRFLTNKIIKPKEEFFARLDQIPDGFRDIIIPVGAFEEDIEKVEKNRVIADEFSLKPKGDLWIIVDSRGKVISGKPMPEEEAKKILAQLK